ncbi:MAG: AAA domain-containing protein [Chloroflexota bacterium]
MRQTIAYWKQSLQDAERNRLRLRANNHIRASFDELDEGQLDAQTTEALYRLKANQSRDRKEPSKPVSVVVAPIIGMRGGKGGTLCPLFLAAKVDRNGRLLPQPRQPWIPRHLLEPTPTNLSLGSLTAVNDFYNDTQLDLPHPEAPDAWQKAHAHAMQMLNEISHDGWEEALEQAGYNFSDQAAIISPENRYGIAANILRVYDYLLENEKAPAPLLENYLNPQPPAPQPPLEPTNWAIPAQFHVGSFSKNFPLSPSQRSALYNLLNQPPATTLAVSGPPGTGKTTLLHSVIASLWVKAALDETNPPIIVAASTNNQAVTNVIDSLTQQTDIERWLPIPSFGLYLVNTPDKQQAAQENGLLTLNKFGDGFPKTIERATFVNQAIPDFLNRCTQKFGQPVRDLTRALQLWHGELFQLAKTLTEGIKIGYRAQASQQEMDEVCAEHGSMAAYLAEKRKALTAVQPALNKWQAIKKAWETQQEAEPWYFQFVPFLPAVKQQRETQAAQFTQTHLTDLRLKKPSTATVNDLIDKQLAAAKKARVAADQAYNSAQLIKKRHEATQIVWQEWCQANAPDLALSSLFRFENGDQPDAANLFNHLDTRQRHALFQAATHYWETRWLLNAQDYGDGFLDTKESRNEATQAQKWYRYGMLTPCYVTTMHTGPSFFDYYNGRSIPLLNHIDLLIVDEAGQVSPELSGAMFALAKQALVVGDTQQIQPVWSIPQHLDIINLQDNGLAQTDKDLAARFAQGISASQGSVMQLAQHVSPLQLPKQTGRGLFLAEHRRSVPEIIGYCNELAYNGRLRPLRPALENHPWPHLGYLHVNGRSTRIGGSRQNAAEAQTLLNWLADNQAKLEDHYERDLDDIVGIITPFAAQKQLLQQLALSRLHLSKIGTVHALQGGERPFILFSSVYTKNNPPRYFFDQGTNMLNVAVSRAQDSFLVFGDMSIFKRDNPTPSGLLAKHLFANPSNVITMNS